MSSKLEKTNFEVFSKLKNCEKPLVCWTWSYFEARSISVRQRPLATPSAFLYWFHHQNSRHFDPCESFPLFRVFCSSSPSAPSSSRRLVFIRAKSLSIVPTLWYNVSRTFFLFFYKFSKKWKIKKPFSFCIVQLKLYFALRGDLFSSLMGSSLTVFGRPWFPKLAFSRLNLPNSSSSLLHSPSAYVNH